MANKCQMKYKINDKQMQNLTITIKRKITAMPTPRNA